MLVLTRGGRFVKKHGYVYDKDVFDKYQRRRGLKKLPVSPAVPPVNLCSFMLSRK